MMKRLPSWTMSRACTTLEAAEASIERGEYYTQEEMEVWLEAKIAARSKPV
jgi:predicted transcriptional regulator